MEFLFKLIEIGATLIENTVIISSVLAVSGRRYSSKKHILLLLLSAALMSSVTTLMNTWQAFSFLTPVFGMVMVLIISRLLSRGSLLVRATACVAAFFVIQSIDYMLFIGMGLLHGNPDETFSTFMTSGAPRTLYLLLDKGADVLLFFVLRKRLHRLSHLRRPLLGLLLGAAALSYGAMQYLFGTVIYGDYEALHAASIVSFLFFLCFLAAVIFSLLSVANMEKQRSVNEILQRTNEMMEQNYQRMHGDIRENAKLLHDFHHHSGAIREMAGQGKTAEIISYVDAMLSTAYEEMKLCHSGCDIIDAVINCKAAEARSRHISFHYKVNFSEQAQLASVDICAVLANQIENAFEACEKISEEHKRVVKVEIRQRDGFALFKVTNSTKENPFQENHRLSSTKTDASRMHGLGLKNIRDIAERYSGSMQTEYENGMFISTVLLCFTPI